MFFNQETNEDSQTKWVFLYQAENEHEANIIESMLDSEGIPVLKKYREAGDYLRIYMGMTNFGIDVYVPHSVYEQAQGLLENKAVDINETDDEYDNE